MRGHSRRHGESVERRILLIAATCLAGCGGGSAALSTCATQATPDLVVVGGFDIDTGIPSSSPVGAAYGQPQCAGQYLVETDLREQATLRADFLVTGIWSPILPRRPCDELATMNVFVFDGASWQPWDVLQSAGVPDGELCGVDTVSHTNASSSGLDVTNIPASFHFQRARIAVRATEGGAALRVEVVGQYL